VTGIVDLTRRGNHGGPARLLDVIDDRSAAALLSWLNEREPTWRAGIATAALNPYRGYASALRGGLPHAVRVLDAFHAVRLGFAAVDDVRRRIQQQLTGHRGRGDDPLFGIRRLLRRGYQHHSPRSWARLLAGLDAGDTDDEQLARTWIAAQELRLIFSCPDRDRAAERRRTGYRYPGDADLRGRRRRPAPAEPAWRQLVHRGRRHEHRHQFST
jgi:transposase